jgi:hypothetical protein
VSAENITLFWEKWMNFPVLQRNGTEMHMATVVEAGNLEEAKRIGGGDTTLGRTVQAAIQQYDTQKGVARPELVPAELVGLYVTSKTDPEIVTLITSLRDAHELCSQDAYQCVNKVRPQAAGSVCCPIGQLNKSWAPSLCQEGDPHYSMVVSICPSFPHLLPAPAQFFNLKLKRSSPEQWQQYMLQLVELLKVMGISKEKVKLLLANQFESFPATAAVPHAEESYLTYMVGARLKALGDAAEWSAHPDAGHAVFQIPEVPPPPAEDPETSPLPDPTKIKRPARLPLTRSAMTAEARGTPPAAKASTAPAPLPSGLALHFPDVAPWNPLAGGAAAAVVGAVAAAAGAGIILLEPKLQEAEDHLNEVLFIRGSGASDGSRCDSLVLAAIEACFTVKFSGALLSPTQYGDPNSKKLACGAYIFKMPKSEQGVYFPLEEWMCSAAQFCKGLNKAIRWLMERAGDLVDPKAKADAVALLSTFHNAIKDAPEREEFVTIGTALAQLVAFAATGDPRLLKSLRAVFKERAILFMEKHCSACRKLGHLAGSPQCSERRPAVGRGGGNGGGGNGGGGNNKKRKYSDFRDGQPREQQGARGPAPAPRADRELHPRANNGGRRDRA